MEWKWRFSCVPGAIFSWIISMSLTEFQKQLTDGRTHSHEYAISHIARCRDLSMLSFQEKRTLFALLDTDDTSEAARKIFLSPKTVYTYASNIGQKLNLSSILQVRQFIFSEFAQDAENAKSVTYWIPAKSTAQCPGHECGLACTSVQHAINLDIISEREHLHSPSSPPVLEFGAEAEKASPGRYYFRGVWPNQAGSCRYLVHQTLWYCCRSDDEKMCDAEVNAGCLHSVILQWLFVIPFSNGFVAKPWGHLRALQWTE